LVQSVLEEKMQRIAEVLVASIPPFELMLGKLIGVVGVSLTITGVYLLGGYLTARHFGFDEYLPPQLVAWFVLFQALAIIMFGSMFIAIGAACSETKEAQSSLMPVILLGCIPMFVGMNVVREPTSSFALGMSFFPPATPMLMVPAVRLVRGPNISRRHPHARQRRQDRRNATLGRAGVAQPLERGGCSVPACWRAEPTTRLHHQTAGN
jgi:ABC-type Na+ efflux pump permease subunit